MVNINFMQDLATASSMNEVKELILKNINFYGVNEFNYGIKAPSIITNEEPYIFSGCSESWINHYKKNKYYLNDATIAYAFQNVQPIEWSDELFQNCAKLREESSDAGIPNGITFPIHGPRGEKGLFAIAGKKKIPFEAMLYINAIVPFIHHKIFELEVSKHDFFQNPRLTPRETEFLKWLAIGKTMEEISIIMNISYRTCVDYSEKLKKKFNCVSKNQIISLAITKNMISL
jgi:DNA-binding CsgD family transcriptional regulator